MTIIPEGFAQLNYIFEPTSPGPIPQITLGLARDLSPLDPTETADLALVHFVDSLFPAITGNEFVVRAHVKFGPNDTGPAGDSSTVTSGLNTAESTSPQVATLIHKLTNFGGRAGRGRIYWPSLPESQVTERGVVSTAWRDNFDTAFDTWATKMSTDSLIPVLLHGLGSPLTQPSGITGFRTDGLAATQRRRLR